MAKKEEVETKTTNKKKVEKNKEEASTTTKAVTKKVTGTSSKTRKKVNAKTEIEDKEKKVPTNAEEQKVKKSRKVIQEEKVDVEEKKEISINEIEETIKEKRNLPKEEIQKINQYLFHNILVAICTIIYFIFLNLGQMNIQGNVYITDLKVFSVCILLLAIVLIEKAYKQDSGKIAIFGIEMIVLSLTTVALIYVNLMQAERYTYIVTSISYVFAIYYLVKSIIIYLKKRKKYFVDDMKEMINNKGEEE